MPRFFKSKIFQYFATKRIGFLFFEGSQFVMLLVALTQLLEFLLVGGEGDLAICDPRIFFPI